MSTCFVIQPFDADKFDKRYRDTFRPAIEGADLEPYRVDHDPAASVPIDAIQEGIRNAAVCFAEISTDNPNVWFELGYAIAAHKPVVLGAADDLPIRHSAPNHHQVQNRFTKRLQAAPRGDNQ